VIKPGRVVQDFVSLTDLAPTFLEAGGLPAPEDMTGRSLMPLLRAEAVGQVDPARDHVLTGMERHVPCRGEINGGYPMRAIRTHDFHFIINFKPERWPAGDPNGYEITGAQPFTYEELTKDTRVAFADVDCSPTKAWILIHRDEPQVRPFYEMHFEKRPARELYDLRRDPYEMHNVAGDPAYTADVARLEARLMAALQATGDLRATGGGDVFDEYPWAASGKGMVPPRELER
jgi:arylsulfatase A-like enzyme